MDYPYSRVPASLQDVQRSEDIRVDEGPWRLVAVRHRTQCGQVEHDIVSMDQVGHLLIITNIAPDLLDALDLIEPSERVLAPIVGETSNLMPRVPESFAEVGADEAACAPDESLDHAASLTGIEALWSACRMSLSFTRS